MRANFSSPSHRLTASVSHPSEPRREVTIMFAGGGSGGHISPGLAIAERLRELAPHCKSIFVCSTRAIDAAMLTDAREQFVAVPATPPSVRPRAAWGFVRNFLRSKRIVANLIRQRRVNHVVALGGFVAVPVVSAAKSCGVPVTLVNLDAPPGRANLWMARRCERVLTAIELPMTPKFAWQVVGMPIRRNSIAPGDAPDCRRELGLDANKPTLLITGASQGAASINAFVTELATKDPAMFSGWQVYHLTGPGANEAVRTSYANAAINAVVEPFQNHMGLAWGAADLAVSRAGASSVAEAARNAVPTIFLPYPWHKDMHQKYNAQPIADLGGSLIMQDQVDAQRNCQTIGPVLRELMQNDRKRQAMRNALKSHVFPDAAGIIAQMLAQLSRASA